MGAQHSEAILATIERVHDWVAGDLPSDGNDSLLAFAAYLSFLALRIILGYPAICLLHGIYWLHRLITVIADAVLYSEPDDEIMLSESRKLVEEWRRKRVGIEKD